MTQQPESVALHTVSAVSAVTSSLREAILAGEIQAGERLTEEELCGRYGVSRHTIRAALARLVETGIARRHRNRRVYVPALKPSDVMDIYALRTIVEVEAVRYLCANPDSLSLVARSLQALSSLPSNASWIDVRDRDLDFHFSLVEAMGRPRTIRAIRPLQDELRLALIQIQGQFEDRDDVIQEHTAMYDSMASNDVEGALAMIQSHLTLASRDICAALAAEWPDESSIERTNEHF